MPQQRGEGTDFERVLTRVMGVVYHRLVARYRDEQLADEVSSDCMAAAWEKWAREPEYFRAHDLVGWACRRARWKAIDVLRQRVRCRPLPEEREGEAAGRLPGVRPRRENDTPARARDKEQLLASLERLPEPERHAVVGYHFNDRTDQDVGAALFEDDASPRAHG